MADIAGAVAGFSSNIQDFKDEVNKLVDVKDGLQMRVDAALNNAEIIFPEVETWLKDADEIQEKIIGIESEITNIQGGSWLAVGSRYSLSKTIKKTTEAMKELRDKCIFDPIGERPPPPAVAAVQLGSRRQIEDDIMTCLKAGKVNMLGICGMGGVGKTTMAKRVMNKAREHNLFDEIVIAVVSQPADMSKVQNEIAESLGLKLEDETLSARAHTLRIRLMGGKRILIVLDDVWKSLNLEDLGIPRESGSKGCTILLTSRDKDVLHEMEAHKIFGISTLSNEEAWSLFREKVGVCADDPNLLSIAQEIVDECKGLPIPIVNVAAELKDKNGKRIWCAARQQLRSGNPVDMPRVLEDVYKPLKLCYDFLGSQNAQSIFLLCCLFPEDSRIRVEDLIAYVWGLRMFEGNRAFKEVRNKTYALVDMLKKRFLLLEVVDEYEHYVRMHDVVRDVAIFIASKERQLIKCGANCIWLSPYLGQEMEESSNRMDFQNLRLLMTDGSVSDISFEGMKDLNVLSMRSVRSLPRTTQLLKSLRTLILDSGFLNSISGIGELVDLEILICRDTCIEELPVEMSRLVRLMKLEISGCEYLRRIAPNIISSLEALKELEIVGSFDGWEAKGRERENAALSELECLSSLTCLSIQIKDPTLAAQHMVIPLHQIVKYDIAIGDYFPPLQRKFNKTMHMYLPGEITSLGNWVLECISRVEYLLLKGEGSNIVDLGQTQKMRTLIFRDCSTTRKLVKISIGSTTVFPYLEYLELQNLANLEDIYQIPKESAINAFKNLKEVSIHRLPRLKHLWENSSTYHARLPQLEKLEISTCGMMEQVFLWNEEDRKVIRFSKLKRLILRDLARLSSFSKGIERIEFPQLTDMTIHNCPLLRNATGDINNHDGCFHWFCNQEKVMFGMLKNLELVNSRNNTALKLWDHQIPLNSFNGLETLYIRNFSSMRSLFSSSTARNLGNLKTLRIHDCEEMVNVVDNEEICEDKENNSTYHARHPQLEKLEISTCEIMEQVFLWNEDEGKVIRFPQLKRLILRDMPRLSSFSKGIERIEFPQLTDMTIHNCPLLRNATGDINNHDGCFHWFCNQEKVMFGMLKNLELVNSRNNTALKLWDHQIPLNSFNGLETLYIRNFSSMRSLFSSSTARNLGNLKTLRIHDCEEMVNVVDNEEICEDKENNSTYHARHPQLEKLEISTCEIMEQVFLWNEDEGKVIRFPQLKRLILRDMPRLSSFSKGIEIIEFPQLTDMTIHNCPLLRSLVSITNATGDINNHDGCLHWFCNQDKANNSTYHARLPQLEKLEISTCEIMEQVFLWNEEDRKVIRFSKLKRLILRDLARLSSFSKGIERIEFPQLTDMTIHNCPLLRSLVSITNATGDINNHDGCFNWFCNQEKFENIRLPVVIILSTHHACLPQLEKLEISTCEIMEQVFLWNEEERKVIRFPQLKRLILRDMPRLNSFSKGIERIEFSQLTDMTIHNCPLLRNATGDINNHDGCFHWFCNQEKEVEDMETTSGGEIVEEEEN